MTKNEDSFKERRKHARLPIIQGVVEPVDVSFQCKSSADGAQATQPAVISNLSAGGMRLMTFVEPPKDKTLEMTLTLPGLGGVPVKGQISWIRSKGGVFLTGIVFTDISKQAIQKIIHMAEDYEDCETRIGLKLPEACVQTCRSHYFCNKPQKDETLFKEHKA